MRRSNKLLYEAKLGVRYPQKGSKDYVEDAVATNQMHPWSGRRLYALIRHKQAITLFVPTPGQLEKIKKHKGTIRVYESQTKSGLGSGSAL